MSQTADRTRSRVLAVVALVFLSPFFGFKSAIAVEPQPSAIESGHSVEVLTSEGKTDVYYLPWTKGDGKTPSIPINAGSSRVIKFDRPIIRVAISDPAICDVVPVARNEMVVNSKKSGKMNLLVWDELGGVSSYDFESSVDTQKLHELLRRIDPAAQFMVVPYQGSLAVYGSSETKAKQDKIDAAVKAFDEKALNFTSTEDPKQVMLEVRFAEVNRQLNKDFKLDADLLNRFTYARSLTGQTGVSSAGGLDINGAYPQRSAVSFDGRPVFDTTGVTESIGNLALTYISSKTLLTAALKWLENKNIIKIVARPNLMAKDGEKATFLVGGEYGYPVISQGEVSVAYKDYGTRLEFTPEVKEGGNISLKIKTEMSELDYTNATTVSGAEVPGILTREQETVAQLKDNQTLVIGGMITQRVNRINYKVPILGDLPFIKTLFASESFTRTDVELLVVITPHIIEPFRMPEGNKFYYDPEQVAEAVKPIVSPYSDPQGDAVQDLIVQTEQHAFFDEKQAAEAKWLAKFNSSKR
jgi:pilus assembly protein CpaC